MGLLANNSLNDLQQEFLKRFFAHENRFFLTGGAALVGFYLHHRLTEDLDLFTLENEIENGVALIREVAEEMNATIESLQTSPDFRRLLLRRGEESIVVDLVREYVFQVDSKKRVVNGIRLDSPEEILANKLCALLSRLEIRDLVDVLALEKAGYSVESALEAAAQKDTGFTPAQLVWVLNQIKFGVDLVPPGGVSRLEIEEYLRGLIIKLTKAAFPQN